ncbi:GNAT family N-acetyltransferase [Sporosarcina sp. PTS2304]|uniref:GNAT family N-acetyltransferase n=1 Tax=Sporosarcina sp. PTS2304 TaxID=2283194 RepID=UPI000E0D27D9|nr:GNAT family N-acetyltransferase [Sporosarcina sp. PTS2304]AXH99799.1 GNAT family N-acetyltransferase [Sporosarcina sp. PTS2304]
MKNDFSIRKLQSNEDMRLVQELEKQVWGEGTLPTHQTYTASKNGGLVIGAFDQQKMVGFSYSFPGFANGKTYLCSHMLGVLPDYQLSGIGKMLKDEQRKLAKEIGYDLITWTFDPLESRNAYLNLTKLYGICTTYLENCYGEMEDSLNKGLPSDRLQVEWWISSERVEELWMPVLSDYDRPFAVRQSEKGNPMMEVLLEGMSLSSDGVEVPIPENIQFIKKNEPELALDWRMKIRAVFQSLFGEGYALVGLRKSDTDVHYYQFVKKTMIPLTIKHEENSNDY